MATNNPPSFIATGNGKVTTDLHGIEHGRSVVLLPDGDLVVGGSSAGGFTLIRYNADGSLDRSFGIDGKAITAVGPTPGDAFDLALQANGQLVMVGTTGRAFGGSTGDVAVLRYNADGSLDSAFGSDGKVVTDLGTGFDVATGLAIQSDGKLVVAAQNGQSEVLLRYNADGSLDTDFGGDGHVSTGLVAQTVGGRVSYGKSPVVIDADGKILTVGQAGQLGSQITVERFNADGTLDTTFASDGSATMAGFGVPYALALQPDGKVLVAGSTNSHLLVGRFNVDGTADTTFSGDGVATGLFTDLMIPSDIAVRADGVIVVAATGGIFTDAGSFTVLQLNPDGSTNVPPERTDTDFGGFFSASAHALVMQPDGRIVLAGSTTTRLTGDDYDFALVRYNADLTLDTTFNGSNTLDGAPTYIVGGTPVILDSDVRVFDPELGQTHAFDGAHLTLTRHGGANAEDVFSWAAGTLAGTVLQNSGGTLEVVFNQDAPAPVVDAFMQSIRYANTGVAPPPSVQIDWTLTDGNTGSQGSGGVGSTTGSTTVHIGLPFLWSDLGDGSNVAPFDAATQALLFDDDGISAADVRVASHGSDTTFTYVNKDVTLGLSLPQVTTGNVFFADHSVLIVGDDTTGTAGDATPNVLTGGSVNDQLIGLGGDDEMHGSGGNDRLIGGAGGDLFDGGPGADYASYEDAGAGVLANLARPAQNTGDATGDRYVSVEGLVGSLFADTLVGNDQANDLWGGDGNDYLQSRDGNDTLHGDVGNDFLEGGAGADALDGGAGFDYARYAYAPAMSAGNTGITADLANVLANTGDAAGDSYASIEGLIGAQFDDSLYGDADRNDLAGLDGDDHIDGRAGNDNLQGGNGDDQLVGGAGADVLKGGNGTDTARYDTSTAGVVASLLGYSGVTGDAVGDVYLSVENLSGTNANDTLIGDDTANTLSGLLGSDYLQGRLGDDALVGGAGNDRLEGGHGADALDGGADFDYASYAYSDAAVRVDLVDTSINLGEALGDTYVSIEGVIGTRFTDAILGDANVNDLAGENGDDFLYGREAHDNLQGMVGNDTLDGGGGQDRLVGGAGNDTFDFVRGEANGDRVEDFEGTAVLGGDQLRFHGYGLGATFTQVDATHWSINPLLGTSEVITIANGATILPADYSFV